jgi:hypothetical protein
MMRSRLVTRRHRNRVIVARGGCAGSWRLGLAPNILLSPGTRTRGHPAENLGAAQVDLDDAARAELRRHFPVR